MESFDKLMDLFAKLDENASYIKINAEELADSEQLDTKKAYREGQDFIKKCVAMNRQLTELIEGKDSAYEICQMVKGES